MNNHPSPEELPDDYEARIRKTRHEGESSLASKALTFLLLAGGAATAAAVIVPGRTSGASRTARLEWQHREAEINRVVTAPASPADPVQP
ncbi:MAG: hypothetical protein K0R17_427 [Rariglobus sp.]|jgi:hypothetical protein|nr:hypothetical protein [Rariglobus sp.]